jgi:hypothetical protein
MWIWNRNIRLCMEVVTVMCQGHLHESYRPHTTDKQQMSLRLLKIRQDRPRLTTWWAVEFHAFGVNHKLSSSFTDGCDVEECQ